MADLTVSADVDTMMGSSNNAAIRSNIGLGTAATQAASAFDAAGAAAAAQAASQPLDTDLTAIAALSSAADKIPYATGAGTWALANFTGLARSIVALTTAAAGGLFYASALDTPAVLSPGSTGQVLQMGASLPAWATFTVPAGSAAAPGLALAGDSDTGLYSVGANNLGWSTAGTLRMDLSTTALTLTVPVLATGSTSLPNFANVGDTNTGLAFRTADTVNLCTNGTSRIDITTTLITTTLPEAQTMPAGSGTQTALYSSTTALHVSLTASTEYTYFRWGGTGNPAVGFLAGTITTQRFAVVNPPSYAFNSASTITNAATFAIAGPPTAGTNATITNAYSFWVQAGKAQFDGGVYVGAAQDLVLGNAYVAGVQVPSGYIVIKDSTGTAYKVSVNV